LESIHKKNKRENEKQSKLMKKKLGLIVNPIAGMGGSVGLKGTDGEDILEKAKNLGAIPIAPNRTNEVLEEISFFKESFNLFTYPNEMGEDEAKACSFDPIVLGSIDKGKTTSANTKDAAKEMLKLKVDLVLFVGGDGTARDIYESVGDRLPTLGIPSGVKMHSGVFTKTAKIAGKLIMMLLRGEVTTRLAEVMDIDEEAFRQNRLSAKLYGYLKIPYEMQMVQSVKSGSVPTEKEAMEEISWYIIDNMKDDYIYIIGPGTTTKTIMKKLGLENTLLGVDVIHKRKLIALDVNEAKLLELIQGRKAKIVVTVIGGQGFIFGRGNQQISPKVIQKIGKENIIVIATENKISSLRGKPLSVDTGDIKIDEMLRGYIRVITGYTKAIIYKVV